MELKTCRRVKAKARVAWHEIKWNDRLLLCAVPKLVNVISDPERISGQTYGMNLLLAHGYGLASFSGAILYLH
ncbi:hypothetical protein LH29_09180 [Draconibacterium sediminis]|uniref:Uncharacterized protein n=1 Tax=Draconibacterium sediminis TaxID=1544798 RepID=A0A0D8JF25_9BACT|nr:hypothetical protein LH29_09180 [Draconibacterium sediminis]